MSFDGHKPYSAYVLWSDRGNRFYIGVSENPVHRLAQHNSPENVGWTARWQPWRLVWRRIYPNFREARRCELRLKRHNSGVGFYAETELKREENRRRPSGS